jgi:hypothetical protein
VGFPCPAGKRANSLICRQASSGAYNTSSIQLPVDKYARPWSKGQCHFEPMSHSGRHLITKGGFEAFGV